MYLKTRFPVLKYVMAFAFASVTGASACMCRNYLLCLIFGQIIKAVMGKEEYLVAGCKVWNFIVSKLQILCAVR